MGIITDFINEYGQAIFIAIAILIISIPNMIGHMRIRWRLSKVTYWLETRLNSNDSQLTEIQISLDRLHDKVDELLRDRDIHL